MSARRTMLWALWLFLGLGCGLRVPGLLAGPSPPTTPTRTAPAPLLPRPPQANRATARPPRATAPGPAASSTASPTATPAQPGVLLFAIGVHVEPLGTTAQGFTSSQRGDYHNPDFLARHGRDLQALAAVVEAHGGVLVIQAQSPFTTALVQSQQPLLADLAARGHEIGLHFHEEVHVGPQAATQPVATWCAAMQAEIAALRAASGGAPIRYWSGGNRYPQVLDAGACAGLTVYGDWKDPRSQSMPAVLMGLNPWRPAGGTDGRDFGLFATHDPAGAVVFLPAGLYTPQMTARDDAEAYFATVAQALQASLEAAAPDRINVFHITLHPGEFRGSDDRPFGVLDDFLTAVVDPMVAAGRLQWATFSQMAAAFAAWEAAHPGQPPR